MKTLKFNKVKYKNIMSVGQEPIEVRLDACHKTLITGTNGTGKSTMLEALCFGLFGKPFRDLKKPQLINSTNKKGLLVEVEMEYDKKQFKVIRGLKPNIFEVYRDGQRIDEDASIRDFQETFEQMIGMNLNSFKQVVVLGTAGYTPFMALSKGDRRRLVEDLLNVSILADMDRLNKFQSRELTQQISVTDLKLEHLKTQIETQEQFKNKQQQKAGADIDRYQKMYDDFVAEAREHKASLEDLVQSLTEVTLGEDPSEELQKLISASEKINTRVQDYKAVIHRHEKGGTCPTCLQQIGADEKIKGKIETAIHDYGIKSSDLNEKISSLNEIMTSFKKQRQEQVRITSEITAKKQIIQDTVMKAKRIKLAIEELSKDIIDNSSEILSLTKDYNDEVKNKSALVIEKYQRGIITDLLKDSGIKGSIIKKYIPYFNKRIAHYLKIMDADYSFTLDEEFNETIKSRGREDFTYNSFSQGEKARIDISLLFTWRDVASQVSGVEISALFLDEVFDGSFDNEGIKRVAQILNSFTDMNIFVISHKDHNPQDYGQHLHLKKRGRFTIIDNAV
ncbi:recombinational endonuclease subunit [Serratia phage Muldoon]|uniref:Recombinational endonuclease subunit n=1 Tax=Serratia phage Muldoon TaxID=2601678 RepID=A0A5P8PH59_9CAUD|nr:SbcC-like subunit of palindrome specific endonuclease [Serratia phage Muldoon]QFR56011.1 recombinational endonuclease subunit [Serratia phage Muldoon]